MKVSSEHIIRLGFGLIIFNLIKPFVFPDYFSAKESMIGAALSFFIVFFGAWLSDREKK